MPLMFDHLFNPTGRIGRKTFLTSAVVILVIGFVCTLIPVAGQVVSLALLWPWTVLATKRLHDMGRSGALAVIMAIASAAVGILGTAVALLALNPAAFLTMAAIIASVGFIVGVAGLAFLIWLAVARGVAGANQYGASEAGSTTVAALFRQN